MASTSRRVQPAMRSTSSMASHGPPSPDPLWPASRSPRTAARFGGNPPRRPGKVPTRPPTQGARFMPPTYPKNPQPVAPAPPQVAPAPPPAQQQGGIQSQPFAPPPGLPPQPAAVPPGQP